MRVCDCDGNDDLRFPETEEVLDNILSERIRQEAKYGTQNHTPIEWISILTEEVGEAAQRANQVRWYKNWTERNDSLVKLREELIQVAAVATAAVECLDRKEWDDQE